MRPRQKVCSKLRSSWVENEPTKFHHIILDLSLVLDLFNSQHSCSKFTDIRKVMSKKFQNGDTIVHLLVRQEEKTVLNNVLKAMDTELRNDMLSFKNYADQTPVQLAQSFEIQSLLSWSFEQDGFYYLPSPPAVIMMYSTLDREDAQLERLQLEAVFPKFKVTMQTYENPTMQQTLEAIRDAQNSDEVSALIVIIMSHGVQGAVEARDGVVQIQDILRTMCSPTLEGKPKVRVLSLKLG